MGGFRPERPLKEQMHSNLRFRWFVGPGIDDPVWLPTVFPKIRNRLLTTRMSPKRTPLLDHAPFGRR